MKLPTIAELNHVAQLMHGLDFGPLPGDLKPGVVHITQQAVLAGVIDDLPVQLSIQFAECLVEYGPKFAKLIEALDEIDKSLGWLEPIGDWFKNSKVYYP